MRSLPRHPALIALLVVLTGCGSPQDRTGAGDASDEGDGLRVALLTSGPVSDAGWYAGAYEGLLMIRDSLGFHVSHQQTRSPAEFDEAFRSYAESGYDLVFAHGFEYQDAALRASERYPELTIVVSNGGLVAPGLHPLILRLEEATYLAGMVAGRTTSTGIIGMVGGVAIPPAVGTFRAFEAGARATNPEVEVLEAFIGSWDDVAAAKEAAVAQLRRGADVIVHNTDAASFGVFQAVREAVADGTPVWAMGMNRDQNDVAPEVIVGSAVIRIPEAFLLVARLMGPDGLPEGPLLNGLATGSVDYVPNPDQDALHPADLLAVLEETREGIRSGTLTVPRVEFLEDDPAR